MKDVHDAVTGRFSQHRHCFSKFETGICMEDTVGQRGGVGPAFPVSKDRKLHIMRILILRKIVFSSGTKE